MIGKSISHYKILEHLGRGGMGTVYKAEDTKLKRFVAIKFLPSDMVKNNDIKSRFIHEAQTASALDHPNICTIHEIDETDDGELFIVMSCYDEGISLGQKMESDSLSLNDAIDICMQITSGLAAAHEKGIIHRDIKPDNIMITSSGVVKILDFGLAKLVGQTQLTTEGTTLGTAAYMSPEQAQGLPIDHRSDIFSLSVMMYELITGKHPFQAEHQLATIYSIINETPSPIRDSFPQVSTTLESIILKGLEKNPDDRYENLDQLKQDIKNLEGIDKLSDENERPHQSKNQIKKTSIFYKLLWVFIPLITIVMFLIFFNPFTSRVSSEERALSNEYVKSALIELKNSNYDQAMIYLNSAVLADPSNSIAWSSMAAASIHLNEIDMAIKQGKQAINLDENNIEAYYNTAYAQEEKGLLNAALENYERAVTLDSLFTRGYSALGNIHIQMGESDKAIQILERALIINPNSQYLYLIYKNLGKAFYTKSEYDSAIVNLETSLTKEIEKVAETRYYLALSYEKTGNNKESVKFFEAYIPIALDPVKRTEAQNHLDSLQSYY